MNNIKVGIAGMGFYFPKTKVCTKDIADEMEMSEKTYNHIGVNSIYVPTDDEQSSYMALEAAKDALDKAGLNASDIDAIIASTFKSDYMHWQLSNYIKDKIKADRAIAIDVKGGCAAYFEAVEMAVDQIRADCEMKNILVVSGERLYGYGWPTFLSSGGQAVILQKGCLDFNYIDFAICNYVKYHDMALVKQGGTAYPFTEDLEWNGSDFVGNVVVKNEMYFENIKPHVYEKFSWVTNKVLRRNGYSIDDIDYMISLVQQDNFDKRVLEAIGRRDIPTAQEFKKDIGHFSGGDIYVLLDKAQKEKRIKKGDLILILGIGGVAWFATLIRY